MVVESLFPGYMFIQMGLDANWAPLRSTRGVSRIVSFGETPLRLDDALIAHLQERAATVPRSELAPGDDVRITRVGFAELDAIFVSMDGEHRVILLLNMLSRQQKISVPIASIIRK
jgi:transcriptional antiterminator RfaH